MPGRLVARDLIIAALIGIGIGVGVGLGLGLLARQLGWSTAFVGPLTGGIVSTLTIVLFQLRSAARAKQPT